LVKEEVFLTTKEICFLFFCLFRRFGRERRTLRENGLNTL